MPARVLVINGNPADATARMVALGGRPYGEGYADALRHFEPELDITILDAADGDTLPPGVALTDFDGVAWTGSALSAYENRPEVTRQLELARAVHAAGVSSFGSCWGQQIVCQALGGEVRANPKGTEIGVARDIARTSDGEGHPMFSGKPDPFDALAIHRDEVVTLPQGARVLASNAMSVIQAVDFEEGWGDFWGVQYHPEFDLHVMATLFRRDEETLLNQHLYPDETAVARAIEDFEALNANPSDSALAAAHGLGQAILDPSCRMAELGNWLVLRVLPRAQA
jgi:GMP synthase (glutamine-hydrolysing)